MTVLRALIVDDEPLARARLRTLLAECRQPPAIAAGEAGSAMDAMKLVQRQQFDVALLDIHMPGADGLRLAQALRTLEQPLPVVFVTAHVEHAVRAFEIEAVDYLTKPVLLPRLQAALEKVARRMTVRHATREPDQDVECLVIVERGRTIRVPLADVLYLKAEQKYVTVRTFDASYLMDGSLNQLEEKYPERFLRVHRNALVTRAAIRELVRSQDPKEGEIWSVRLAGVDEELTVSRRQSASVRQSLGRRG